MSATNLSNSRDEKLKEKLREHDQRAKLVKQIVIERIKLDDPVDPIYPVDHVRYAIDVANELINKLKEQY